MLIGKKTERAQASVFLWRRENLSLRQHPGKRLKVRGFMLLDRFLNFIGERTRIVEGGFDLERRHAKMSGSFLDIIFVTARDPRHFPHRKR